MPAIGKLPFPPAILSLISPPVPVAAPLKGSTVVGKLCVSALRLITVLASSVTKKSGLEPLAGWNIFTVGPSRKAQLSLYALTIRFGFSWLVLFIILKSELSISLPSITKIPLKILCLQCSLFTCENPKTSLSVRGLPSLRLNPLRYSISSLLRARPSCWL